MGAGVVTFGLGAALVGGAGIAAADDGSGGTGTSSSSGAESSGSTDTDSGDTKDTTTTTTDDTTSTDDDTPTDDDDDTTTDDDEETEPVDEDVDDDDDEDVDEDVDESPSDHDADTVAGPADSNDPPVTTGPEEDPKAVELETDTGIDTLEAPVPTSEPAAFRTFDAPSAAAFAAPVVAQTTQVTSVPIVGPIFAGLVKDYQDRLNPLISAALGVYHLQTAVVELRTLHLPSAFLNLLNAAFSLSTAGLYLIPWGGWLSPIPAALGTGTAYVNGVGKALIPFW